jgi:hypothetical protein
MGLLLVFEVDGQLQCRTLILEQAASQSGCTFDLVAFKGSIH